jgi:uroporphyrinogen decarboxylase
MTGKERFLTALKCGTPDRVPIFDFIDSTDFIQRVTGRRPEAYRAQDIMDVTRAYGFDGAFIGYGGFGGYDTTDEFELDQNHYRDEWGTVYEKTGYSWPMDAPVDFPVKDREDLKRYRIPDPELPERMAEIELAQDLAGDRAAVVGGVQGPLTTAILISGLTNVFSKIIDDPGFVQDLFKMSNEYFVVAVRKMIEARVDVICIPEDLGYVSGPFFSVIHFRELLLPFLRELFEEAMGAGVPTFLHCDGNINQYLDDLLSIGFNGLHPVQRTAGMSIRGIREQYGTGICLIGNVDSSHTLVQGTEDRIVYETLETIRDGAVDGSLILASDSDIRNEMPFEKVDLMFKTALEYGKYPIDVHALGERMKRCGADG